MEESFIQPPTNSSEKSRDDITDSAPPTDQRKKPKREGRSKTIDWVEFRPGEDNESDKPPRKRADTLVISSTSSPSSTNHTDKPPQRDEEVVRECQERLHQSSPSSGTASEPPSKIPHKVSMEIDQTRDTQEADGHRTARKNSDVQVEIEQRWHQVETTPLREEKQVPIAGSSSNSTSNVPVGEGHHPQEVSTVLEKEVRETTVRSGVTW